MIPEAAGAGKRDDPLGRERSALQQFGLHSPEGPHLDVELLQGGFGPRIIERLRGSEQRFEQALGIGDFSECYFQRIGIHAAQCLSIETRH